MARTVWKYNLPTSPVRQEIKVPPGAQLISVGEDEADGDILLWAIVDTAVVHIFEPRRVTVISTYDVLPEGILRFIGTVQRVLHGGTVYHVFEG